MRPITVTAGPLVAAVANSIAHSQTPGAAGALTLTATPVVLDNPRQVLITTTADETSKTFTITGTNATGDTISEVVTGVNNTTVASKLSYKTVISIVVSAATAGALTVGTNGVGESQWARLDEWAQPNISIQCNVSGTANYTVQQSLDDPNSPTNPVLPSAMTWVNNPDANQVASAGATQSFYNFTPLWAKIVLNSGTGTVTATFSQGGVVPY